MTPKYRERFYRMLAAVALWSLLCVLLASLFNNSMLAALVALGITALALELWRKRLRYELLPTRFGEVLPGRLFRSGQLSRWHVARIFSRHGIAAVVNLTPQPRQPTPAQQAEQQAIADLGLATERCVMRGDGTGELEAVAAAVMAIQRNIAAGKPVLVHCAAGVQRTGHVLSAYLLLIEQVEPARVYQYMERYGWEPQRSTAWPQQLNRRMAALAALAAILAEKGVLKEIPAPLPRFPERKPQWLMPWWLSPGQLLRPEVAASSRL